MKKIIGIVLAVVCVAVSGTVFGVLNSPKNVMFRSLSNSMESFAERSEIAPIGEIFNGGSIAVKYDGGEDISAGGKIYFNLDKKEAYLENLSLSSLGISISADIYSNEDMIILNNEKYLGGAYGLKFKDLSEQFKNSILYHESSSEYALDKETSEMVMQSLDMFEESLKNTSKDILKIEEKYTKKLVNLLEKYGDFDSDNETVNLNGEEITGRVVTLELKEDDIYNVIVDLINFIKEDKELKEVFIKQIESGLTNNPIIGSETVDAEEIYNQLIEGLDYLVTVAEEILDYDFEFNFSVVTPKLSAEVLQIEIEVNFDDMENSFEIDFGKDGIEKTNCIAAYFNDEKVVEYEVEQIGENITNIEMIYFVDSYYGPDHMNLFTINLDKGANKFTISAMDEAYKIIGEYKVEGDKHGFAPNIIVIDGEVTTLENIEITFDINDDMPKVNKEFNNVFEITEEKIEEILNKAMEDFA